MTTENEQSLELSSLKDIEDELTNPSSSDEGISLVEDRLTFDEETAIKESDAIEDNEETATEKIPTKEEDKIVNDNSNSVFKGIDSDEDDFDVFMNKTKRRTMIDSDEEDISAVKSRVSSQSALQTRDEDEENEFNTKEEIKEKKRIISDQDSDDESLTFENEKSGTDIKIQYRADIFDTETTDDEGNSKSNESHHSDSNDEEESNVNVSKKKPSKKSSEKKQSLKERKQERMEIHSTSQKMLRESQVSLPYHKPRQRTLMEFLSRKKSVPDQHPEKRRSLKMSMRDVNHLMEIEERKKDVPKFFKSDSEDDEEETTNETELKETTNETELKEKKKTNGTELKEKSEITAAPSTSSDEEDFEFPDLEATDTIQEPKSTTEERMEDDLLLNDSTNDDDLTADTNHGTKVEDRQKTCSRNINCTPSNEDKCIDAESENEDFRLHLDTEDFDENFTEDIMKEKETANSSSQGSSEFGTQNKTPQTLVNITPKLNLLASKYPHLNIEELTNVTPKLSLGEEGDFLTLSQDDFHTPGRQKGVLELFDRFIKHSNTRRKPAEAHNVSLGVVKKEVNAEGEEKLVHSNICVNIDAEEETGPKDETPGAPLMKLRKTLRAQLLENREKERQRREKEKQFMDSEQVIQDYDDGLPDEEHELTDQDETDYETESEPEEDDVVLTDKKRKKNKYLDEEAEEDERGSDEGEKDRGERLDEDECDEDGDNEENEDEDEESESEDEENRNQSKLSSKKKFSRILDDDEDESNDEHGAENEHEHEHNDEDDAGNEPEVLEKKSSSLSLSRASTQDLFSSQTQGRLSMRLKKDSRSTSSMDLSFELMGSVFPAHQPKGGMTKGGVKEIESSVETALSASSLTPFSKLENQKFRERSFTEEVADSPHRDSGMFFLLTPLKDSQISSSNTESIKRSLQLHSPLKNDIGKNEASSDMLDLCSGQFTAEESQKASESPHQPLTQGMSDLIGLCSGQFNTPAVASQGFPFSQPKEGASKGEDDDKQKSSLMNRLSSADTVVLSPVKDSLPEVDNTSPKKRDTLTHSPKKRETFIYSSDEEDILSRQEAQMKRKKKKRKRARILSDDEEHSSNSSSDDNEEEEEAIGYDEDEQPILKGKFSGFKDTRGGIRSDFLDKEAELSGSEVGSGDEDEPDEMNDFMEQEEGDLEKFDEDELRDQVGRAHLKSLIDNDTREVRLLQEMLLEDGDLHGEGRQRKFRWKNLPNLDNDGPKCEDEDEEEEVDDCEEEAEAEWRKQRFEREKFLREAKKEKEGNASPEKLPEIIPSLEKTSSLKLVRSVSLKTAPPLKPLNSTYSQDSSPLFVNRANKRGSFLSRDQSTLSRLAKFTKENNTVGGAKQGGNFVFQTLTEEEVEKRSKDVVKKIETKSSKPPPQKKVRLERSFFSMEECVQSASIFKHL